MTRNAETDELVETLQRVEERLHELAYESLRAAAEDGDEDAVTHERQLQKARRGVERAIAALGAKELDD